MNCSRKVGRPAGGCLNPEEKIESIRKAREAQKRWRLENPDRHAEHIKNYHERKKNQNKEINKEKILVKFIKRLSNVGIVGTLGDVSSIQEQTLKQCPVS